MRLIRHLFYRFLIVITMLLPLSWATPTAHATSDHTLKFYIDPTLVPDLNFAQTVLPKYVADMNTILAKNSGQHLSFDPQTGIILTSTQPYSGSGGNLPTTGYEVWAHVMPSTLYPNYPFSYGGNMSFDQSGAAALGGLHWLALHDPDTLASGSDALHDYWIQVDHMLHELGHVFGAGMGEYYNLSQINDTTGVAPLQNISLQTAGDPYWADKPDFQPDPMLAIAWDNPRVGSPTSRQALLDTVRYSDLTAAIMSANYRQPTVKPPTVDLANINVRVIDYDTGLPLDGAQTKVWTVQGTGGNPSTLQYDQLTDGAGNSTFAWGTPGDPHNNFDFLKLVKVYKAGYTAVAKYISIFDTDIAKLVNGQPTYTATVELTAADTTAPSVSVTSPANGANVPVASDVTINANASDNASVTKVEFSVNGNLSCTDTSAPYSCAWHVPNPSGVAYTLQAKAYDPSGNTSTSTVSVTSQSALTVAITAPANGALVAKNKNLTINATATDNFAITKIEFFVNSALKCTDTTSPYSCVWKAPNTAGVQYTIQAKATDALGNTKTATITVTSK